MKTHLRPVDRQTSPENHSSDRASNQVTQFKEQIPLVLFIILLFFLLFIIFPGSLLNPTISSSSYLKLINLEVLTNNLQDEFLSCLTVCQKDFGPLLCPSYFLNGKQTQGLEAWQPSCGHEATSMRTRIYMLRSCSRKIEKAGAPSQTTLPQSSICTWYHIYLSFWYLQLNAFLTYTEI